MIWTKTCAVLLLSFLFAPSLFAQTGGQIYIPDNDVSPTPTDGTTYAWVGQINTNSNTNSGLGTIGWHDVEIHFDGSGSTTSGNPFNFLTPVGGSFDSSITDTGSIPEPSSLVLFFALAPLLHRRRLRVPTV